MSGRGRRRTAGTASGSCARTTTSAGRSARPTNDEGQIFIEPQGMCVMAGIGLDDGRAARRSTRVARAARDRRTASCCCSPRTQRYHVELGEISSYPPGYKENGGVFCHTNPWVIDRRDDRRQRRRRARLLPAHQPVGARGDQRRPPLRAVRLRADDRRPRRADHGEAKNSWLTGTAAWNYVAITQWILGIRPEHDGLRIDPCLPAAWNGFTARRGGSAARPTRSRCADLRRRRAGE